MKHKKTIAAILALASLSTLTPLTAFAAEPTQITPASDNPTGNMEVSYDVAAAYTVTIPAAVTLGDTEQPAEISAENVLLEKGETVKVTLSGASNTTGNATTFHAKCGDSTATYNITAGGTAVALGGTIATFETKAEKQNVALKFSAPTGATYAGKHIEQLTFTIAVDVAVSGITLNKTSAEIAIGENETLTATVTPPDATDQTVTWASSDTTVATVDENGKITGVGLGAATITATSGGFSASCTVTVNKVTLTNSAFPKKDNNTTNFAPIDTGLVKVTFDNKGANCGNSQNQDGWYFYGENATITVTPSAAGMEIAKVKFYTKKGSAELTSAPFTVYNYEYKTYTAPNGGGICLNDFGVNKIEVYFE